jgi:16S rRNA (uracil1498-N3)-methyltransferase
MIRLFIPHDLAAGAEMALDTGQSRYLAAVMRQAVGDEVALFNGRDGEWRATITVVGKRAVGVRAEARTRPQAAGRWSNAPVSRRSSRRPPNWARAACGR